MPFQVWTLREATENAELHTQCRGLSKTARAKLLTSKGLNTLDHALKGVIPSALDSPMGLMHVEMEGNLKVHIPCFVFMAVRVHKWFTLDELNTAIARYNWPVGRADRPPVFHHSVIEGTRDLTPKSDASLGWTAAQVMHFTLHSMAIIRPILPTKALREKVWTCFALHQAYFVMLLQTSFALADIALLDRLIYRQQRLFLSIVHYDEHWRPKNHYAQHFPVDILRFGPPTMYWEMKCEMKHQEMKGYASSSNFVNVAQTVAVQADAKTALDFAAGKHLHFHSPKLTPMACETYRQGSSHIIDAMYNAGALQTGAGVQITWATLLHIGRLTYSRGSWVLLGISGSSASTPILAQLLELFEVLVHSQRVIFLHYVVYPNALEISAEFNTWCLKNDTGIDPFSATQEPSHPTRAETVHTSALQALSITLLHPAAIQYEDTHKTVFLKI